MGLNIVKKLLFKNLSFKYTKMLASINLKPKELEIGENSKCLCLAPHADDESIGMGGVLSLYSKNFDVILLTDGRKGVKDLSPEEVTELREKEFSSAMKVAGIADYKFLRVQDKKLLDNYDIFKSIKVEDYDYIFLPNVIDQHPDHKAVSILLEKLLEEKSSYKKDLKICFYEVWSVLGFVNAFVDITETAETKKAMLNCYESQTKQKDYVYHSLGLNQYRGMFKDKKFVEAFCVMAVDEFKKMAKLYS